MATANPVPNTPVEADYQRLKARLHEQLVESFFCRGFLRIIFPKRLDYPGGIMPFIESFLAVFAKKSQSCSGVFNTLKRQAQEETVVNMVEQGDWRVNIHNLYFILA